MDAVNKTYSPEEVFNGKQAPEEVSKKKLLGKGFILASCAIVLIMGAIFLLSLLYSEDGSFTVRVGDLNGAGGISLSETKGFANPTVKLSGIPMDGMDNTTYEWLPLEQLDTISGSHNGEDYIAYTFYIKNQLDKSIDYSVALNVLKATKGVDKAVRVMVYRDGTPTVYAKERTDGGIEKVPKNVVNFESDDRVVTDVLEGVAPGEIRKYTIVMWLEGEDPECENDILKGVMKFDIQIDQIKKDN